MDIYNTLYHDRNNSTTTPDACRRGTRKLDESIQLLLSNESTRPIRTSRSKKPQLGDSTDTRQKLGMRQRLSQWANDRWLFEIAALLLSAVALGGIVATLALHQDRPLPQWPFGITISALVSTLSTVSKSALLTALAAAISQRKWIRLSYGVHSLSELEVYDEASRGPYGSLSLLREIKFSDMASFGALITILSLAFDPFLQQIIHFENVPLAVGQSSISSRVIFEMGVSPMGVATRDVFAQTPTAFTPLVNQGLYFDGDLNDSFSRNQLQLRSKSMGGNVTFPDAETLAVCSECANITHLLPPPSSTDTNCDPGWWSWSLPNGVTTHCTLYGDRTTMVLNSVANAELLEIDVTGRLTILNLTIIAPTWIYVNENATKGAGRSGAAQECTLYWCVNKYRSTLRGGVLNETLVSSTARGAFEPNDVPFFSIKPFGSNASISRPDNSELYGDYPSGWINGSFLINTDSMAILKKYFLDKFLTGYIVSLNYYNPGAAVPDFPQLLRLYSKAWWEGPENTTHIDVTSIFEAIAQGMTTVIRSPDQHAGGTDALVNIWGPETTMEVIVRVRWAWITLPSTLLATGFIFVFETVIKNSRWGRNLESWKSSSLAVLFVGMNLADQLEHGGVNKLVDMVNIASGYMPKIRSKAGA